jgi:hypothetical protein
MSDFPTQDVPRSGLVAPVVAALSRLRAGARRRLLVQTLGLLVGGLVMGGLLVGLFDYLFRLPLALRYFFWFAGIACAVWGVRTFVLPALRFAPTLSEIALRLERWGATSATPLPGVIASGLELASHADDPGPTGVLSRSAAERAVAAMRSIRPGDLLNPRLTRRCLGALALAAAPLLALALGAPHLSKIGAQRVLAPWTNAHWPKRTAIADATGVSAHALGAALPLRAVLSRTDRAPGKTAVEVSYRVLTNDIAGPTRRAIMTPQPRGEQARGELFERLFEPGSLVSATSPATPLPRVEIEYWFSTDDDATEPARVALVEPPAIESATVTVVPPAYADPSREGFPFVHGVRELGPGIDERATVSPVLQGSDAVVTFTLNKPVPTPSADDLEGTRAFLADAFPGVDSSLFRSAAFDGPRWTLELLLTKPTRLAPVLRDEHGILASDEPLYRFDSVEDRPPTAVVVEPPQDESVLPTAVIAAAGEGRDDVGLASLALRRQVMRAGDSNAPAPEAGEDSDPVVIATQDVPSGLSPRVSASVALGELRVKPGDEVHLTALAADSRPADLAGAPVVSGVRRLRVISESELIEQFRAELGGIREASIRLAQEQTRLSELRPQASEDPAQASSQRPRQQAITERLGPLDDVVKRLASRKERNQLDDRELENLLQDTGDLLESAAQASRAAADALSSLSAKDQPEQKRNQAAQTLADQQTEVDESLTQIAQILDRGQDSWAVRRTLEKLLAEQKQLASQTAAASQDTAGKPLESLDKAQRDDLERLASRQNDLAQRSAAAIESMESRAQQMRESDPGQSKAMQQAADRAREDRLDKAQRDAAEQIRENKTGDAQANQQDATDALERALEQLDKVQKERDDALRRLLAEVVESIKALLAAQQAEILALTEASRRTDLQGLDQGMIRLNQDTLAVSDRVQAQVKEATRLPDLLAAASQAQGGAIKALRLTPPDAADADAAERVSLQRLREALEEAQKLDQEAEGRDSDRKLAELLKAYREMLELQVALRDETAPLSNKDLSRRERAEARALGSRQKSIRDRLATLREQTQEISETIVLEFAHKRLDRALDNAVRPLLDATVPASVVRDQATIIATLKTMVTALADEQKKRDDFRDDPNAGGGGGGGEGQGKQGLLPPIAELKLLRGMQAQAAESTRTLDAVKPTPDAELAELAELQGEISRLGQKMAEQLNDQQDGPDGDTPKDDAKNEPAPEGDPQ